MREDHEKLERCLDAVQTAFAKSVKKVRGPAPLKQITREQVCHWHISDTPKLPEKHPNVSEIWQAMFDTQPGDPDSKFKGSDIWVNPTHLYVTLYLWHGMTPIDEETVSEWLERHIKFGVMERVYKFSVETHGYKW